MFVRPAGPFVPSIIVKLEDDQVDGLKTALRYVNPHGGTTGALSRASGDADDPDSAATLLEAAALLGLSHLEDFLADRPWLTSYRLIRYALSKLWDHEADADRIGVLRPIRSLASYYELRYWEVSPRQVGLSALPPVGRALLRKLQSLPGVERAYLEPEVREATFDPGFAWQKYLHGAHTDQSQSSGINATSVWGSYTGSGVGFTDLERGWNLTHRDFPGGLVVLNGNDNVPEHSDHGTKALGAVIAIPDNDISIAGIASGAVTKGVLSYSKLATDADGNSIENPNLTAAIVDALDHLAVGDVLLIEVQAIEPGLSSGALPVESEDHWFDAIRLVSGLGRVVIEPAGNGGGASLDVSCPDRVRGGDGDSGAILVSGCDPVPRLDLGVVKHVMDPDVKHGTRVDCYAWSQYVRTTIDPLSSGGPDHGNWGGTSAAVPIVAGAAILTQQMYEDVMGTRASPSALRVILSTHGTPVAPAWGESATHVMPDLGAIRSALNALPDVYVRDAVYDDGSTPRSSVSQSPDVFVKRSAAADKNATYGDLSTLRDQLPVNDPVKAGVPNHVYVRMLNRGSKEAQKVTASVYWGDASTLLTPSSWHYIGTSAPVDVPPGDVVVVADPIVWQPTSDEVPSTTHGCFIVVLDHPEDPKPAELPDEDPSTSLGITWAAFLSYVGANNNIGWRNFDFLRPLPQFTGTPAAAPEDDVSGARIFLEEPLAEIVLGFDPIEWWSENPRELPTSVELPEPAEPSKRTRDDGFHHYEATFYLRSFLGAQHTYNLEVIRDLPQGSELWWELPGEAALALGRGGVRELDRFDLPEVVRLVLSERTFERWAVSRDESSRPLRERAYQRPSVHRFPRIGLPPGASYACRFRVTMPRDGGHGLVAIRQLHRDVEVGRVTYRLDPSP